MNIFEFGMQMEKDGEQFYRELAAKAGSKGLTHILEKLADSEVDHFNTLKKLSENSDPALAESHLLTDVKNVFAGMKEKENAFDFNVSQADLYRKAQDLEKKSEAFYMEQSAAAESSDHKDIFDRFAAEEKQHVVILENIIEFISRPDAWLENAEWHHMEEY
jgi:rubrerythrin